MEKATKTVVLRLTPSEYAAFVSACNAGVRTTQSAVLRGLIYEYVQKHKPVPVAEPKPPTVVRTRVIDPDSRTTYPIHTTPTIHTTPVHPTPTQPAPTVRPTPTNQSAAAALSARLDALFDGEPDTTDTEGNPPPDFYE